MDTTKQRCKARKKCRLQSTIDIDLEKALHDKLLYHFGNGVRLNQSIIEVCAKELKTDFPGAANISRRWIESFLDKKGYSWKKMRGSKGLIPSTDIDTCRNQIRNETKHYEPCNIVSFDETGRDLRS